MLGFGSFIQLLSAVELCRHQFCNFNNYHLTMRFLICITVLSSGESNGDVNGERADSSADQPVLSSQTYKQSEVCCGKHGLCSHEVLRDGDPDSDCNVVQNRMTRKVVSFAAAK